MAEQDEKKILGRSQFIQDLERTVTGILGVSIIATMISIPTILVIFLIYYFFFH